MFLGFFALFNQRGMIGRAVKAYFYQWIAFNE